MISAKEQLKIKYVFLLLLVLITVIASGCAGSKVATDLLTDVETKSEPLINNSVTITTEINPAINNNEKIDESVKESLEIALINANIFGADSSQPYRISANITVASQARWSGSFEGKLEIAYILFDESNNKIIDETIYTEAGNDKWAFSGNKRHRRSRAVNISKNVLQFVEILQSQLKQDTK